MEFLANSIAVALVAVIAFCVGVVMGRAIQRTRTPGSLLNVGGQTHQGHGDPMEPSSVVSEAKGGCPCLYVEPCTPHCTCVEPASSHGCLRCCTYGSFGQRQAAARRICTGG